MTQDQDERSPLLSRSEDEHPEVLDFEKDDPENPKNWTFFRKYLNVAIIALMAILSPLASSMFTPGINQIAEDLKTTPPAVVGATTGFVVSLGLGPMLLAPLSEEFGRRRLYLASFSIFTLLQIPTALSPNVETLVAIRTLSGFFGSVGIANGGGTISDMFDPSERAGVFGWYLLGPLLGPALGPLFGGFIVQDLGWRWIFWIVTIICAVNTILAFLFLKESRASVILEARKEKMERSQGGTFRSAQQDDRSVRTKMLSSIQRPFRILFTQPMVFTMATYQAVIYGTTYTLYTNFEDIYGKGYGFDSNRVGLMYLGPGLGFVIAVWFLVPRIDTIFNHLTKLNHGESKPEFRLPIANIGAVLFPLSLFWFAWTVEFHVHWSASIVSMVFFGLSQVTIFNSVQNYYIDSFQQYAASAIAAGATFRSIVGGLLPLAAPPLFGKLGYGWGVSVFAFAGVALAPAPLLFFLYGEKLRKRYAIEL